MRLSSTEPSNHSRILKNPSKTIKPSSQEAEKALAYVLFLYSKTRIWGSGGSILGSGRPILRVRRVDFGVREGVPGSILGVQTPILGQFWVFWRSRGRFWVNFGSISGSGRDPGVNPGVCFGSILSQFWSPRPGFGGPNLGFGGLRVDFDSF